jgi:hypothetical protein
MFKEEVIENGLIISSILFIGGAFLFLRYGSSYSAWFTLSTSFGILAAFISRKIHGRRLKIFLSIFSWAVPSICLISGIILMLINFFSK